MKEHVPVLVGEVLEILHIKKNGKYIDATVGAGGHGLEIVKRGGQLLGIDQDPTAVRLAKEKLEGRGWKVEVVQGSFANVAQIAQHHGFVPADGILFDLGASSMQLGKSGRGFSFQEDEPLDMRMNKDNSAVTAADLLNALREDQLVELFRTTTDLAFARRVARLVVKTRATKKIARTSDLVNLVNQTSQRPRGKIHPATTIFLALRMAVNSELDNLKQALPEAVKILISRGRLVVISFHSGEDRIVKQFFREQGKSGVIKMITKKPITPLPEEIWQNPRARSAKLRFAQKL